MNTKFLEFLGESKRTFVQNQEEIKIQNNLICINGNQYPKYNQVIIMQGQSGSGKGYVRENLLGVEGMVFDIDDVKKNSLRSKHIRNRVKREFNKDLSKFSLKNPEHVQELHTLLGDELKITKLKERVQLNSVQRIPKDRKPNLIFDVTLKDISKLQHISKCVQAQGYQKENISIVWVLNSVETQIKQNQSRDRTISNELLQKIHKEVNSTIKELMSYDVIRYLDGEIYFVLGSTQSQIESVNGGKFLNNQKYYKVKETFKDIQLLKEVKKAVKPILGRIKFKDFLGV